MQALIDDVVATIRDVPDFPKEGILFKDITPVLGNPALFKRVIGWMRDAYADAGVTHVVGMESRGFIFGTALAMELDAGFVPARKKGKLPYRTVGVEYDLEYGSASLELHVDSVGGGHRVLIVDDLLATGGTAAATVDLVRQLGAEPLGALFLLELGFLDGRSKLDLPVQSLIIY